MSGVMNRPDVPDHTITTALRVVIMWSTDNRRFRMRGSHYIDNLYVTLCCVVWITTGGWEINEEHGFTFSLEEDGLMGGSVVRGGLGVHCKSKLIILVFPT